MIERDGSEPTVSPNMETKILREWSEEIENNPVQTTELEEYLTDIENLEKELLIAKLKKEFESRKVAQ